MAPTSSPDARADYERDRQFVLALAAFLDALPQSPTTIVGSGTSDGTVEYREIPTPTVNLVVGLACGLAAGEARARGGRDRIGLRLALQDLLEMSRDLTSDGVAAADRSLTQAGLPTLSAVRLRVWQTIPKVLRRGRIRTDAEYYLLVERLNDVSGEEDSLSVEDRVVLARLVNEHEQQAAGRGRRS
jgi:hypothetical protein